MRPARYGCIRTVRRRPNRQHRLRRLRRRVTNRCRCHQQPTALEHRGGPENRAGRTSSPACLRHDRRRYAGGAADHDDAGLRAQTSRQRREAIDRPALAGQRVRARCRRRSSAPYPACRQIAARALARRSRCTSRVSRQARRQAIRTSGFEIALAQPSRAPRRCAHIAMRSQQTKRASSCLWNPGRKRSRSAAPIQRVRRLRCRSKACA